MTYELAKSLKDAGFPQTGDGFALVPNRKLPESDETMSVIPWCQYVYHPTSEHGKTLYAPTLTELIRACGEPFKYLHFHQERFKPSNGQWSAKYRDANGKYHILWGHDPEEAVAHLYLALHDK